MKCADTAGTVAPSARVVFLLILVAILGITPSMAVSAPASTGRQAPRPGLGTNAASGTGAASTGGPGFAKATPDRPVASGNPAGGAATSSQATAIAPATPLEPEELLLVYNGNDPRSRELAEYYSTARNVPMDCLCPVRVKLNQEEITREQYDRLIREPLRAFIERRAQGRRIRCIVLFYGVPIRVGPKLADAAEQKLAEQWQKDFHLGVEQLQRLIERLESVGATSQPTSKPDENAAAGDEQRFGRLVQRYRVACTMVGELIQRNAGTPQVQQQYRQLIGAAQAVEGIVGILARAEVNKQSPEALGQVNKIVEQVRTTEMQLTKARERPLTDPARESVRPLIGQNYGLIGYLSSLDRDIALTRVAETTASVDSELMLVCWTPYALYRWTPNLLSWNVRYEPGKYGSVTLGQSASPVLMTCRIDGPSASVAQRMIDESIAAEKRGLTGRVYLDARGLSGDKGHAEYDQDLRELASMLRRHTPLDVRLDNRETLFAPGDCPDAMLYCGWYSVRKYVKACTFVPGAVGYHIASFEAVTIKTPGESGWVRGLLNDGLDATLGPVAEPYLHSFPKPTQFFGLLLTGRFSLAECYAYTTDLNSWMMLFIGDPLYRPFAAKPLLTLDQVYAAGRIPPEFRAAPAASRPTAR